MVKVNINIDKIVFDGFNYHDHLRISRAMKQELSRLVSENGLPKTGDLHVINSGSFNIKEDMSPKNVGIAIAQSIYGSLGKNE